MAGESGITAAVKSMGDVGVVLPIVGVVFIGQKLGLIGVGPRTPKWFRPAAAQVWTEMGPEFKPAPAK